MRDLLASQGVVALRDSNANEIQVTINGFVLAGVGERRPTDAMLPGVIEFAALPFWLFGVVWVMFPRAVLRFYSWFHGPHFDRRNFQPRHVRNAGIAWLLLMAMITYLARNQGKGL